MRALILPAAAIAVGGAFYFYKMREAENTYALSKPRLRKLIQKFQQEMTNGLREPSASHPVSSLKMLNSGKERGSFYGIDVGGTNFRILRVDLQGEGKIAATFVKSFKITKELQRGSGEKLFDFFAECVGIFLSEQGVRDQSLPLGFTFSYPVEVTGLNSARLITWTKGFTASDVEGRDVVVLLQQALDRKKISAQIVAIANDTVSTHMTQAYQDNRTEMAVCVGTGSNGCYVASMQDIKKLYGTGIKPKGEGGMIINIEWGAFCDLSPQDLPITEVDELVDKNSINPGRQRFEKLVGGMYLGEIVRYTLLHRIQHEKLFGGRVPDSLTKDYYFETSWMSELASNPASIDNLLREKVGIEQFSDKDKETVRKICADVALRAAQLNAVAITSVLSLMDRLQNVTVAIEGSMLERYPGFPDMIGHNIKELFPHSDVTLKITKDGSVVGIAVIAAVTSETLLSNS